MSLLVTGSIGIDSVTTPYGQVREVLGGSAVYFAFAASLFTPVRLAGVIGQDFPEAFREVLAERPIDLTGLETRPHSKTFRWIGRYQGDMNVAETLDVQLNVLAERGAAIPETFRDSAFVFLANTHPALQRDLLGQLRAPKLAVCDTMNFWIETQRDELLRTFSVVQGVVLNDGEARMLTGQSNLVLAARSVLEAGPAFVVIKKGEHGVMLVTADQIVALPAWPSTSVKDPTGAGDSFAGGMMGYLAAKGTFGPGELKTAIAYGTITASFAIEDFSLEGLRRISRDDVDRRLERFCSMMRFD